MIEVKKTMGNVQQKLRRRKRLQKSVFIKVMSVEQKHTVRLGVNYYTGREINTSLRLHQQFNPDPRTFTGGLLYYPIRNVFEKLGVGDIVCIIRPIYNAQNVMVQGTDYIKTDELFIEDFRYLSDLSTIQWLVEKGARINQEILIWSIIRNRLDIFKYLVEKGGVATEDVWRCLLRYSRAEMIGVLDGY